MINPEIPPAVLARVDQVEAAFNEEVDRLTKLLREGIAVDGRQKAVAFVADRLLEIHPPEVLALFAVVAMARRIEDKP